MSDQKDKHTMHNEIVKKWVRLQMMPSRVQYALTRESGVTFVEIVMYVALFAVPLAILFWFARGEIAKFWDEQVICRFQGNNGSGGSCQNTQSDYDNLVNQNN